MSDRGKVSAGGTYKGSWPEEQQRLLSASFKRLESDNLAACARIAELEAEVERLRGWLDKIERFAGLSADELRLMAGSALNAQDQEDRQ